MLEDERRLSHGGVSRPFASIPVEQLSRHGYVVSRDDGSTDFYAPDADVLLSDAFLDDHCFRFVAGNDGRAGMVGLGFEPVPGRRVAEITGVLWLNAASSELAELEFTYVELPFGELDGEFGGEVGFSRLPTGRWIVDRWVIRMPVVGERPRSRLTLPDGRPVDLPSRRVLVAVREEGGTVQLDRAEPPPRKAISGVAFDSASGKPAVGARVSILGTGIAATTGTDGRFAIRNVPAGLYSIVLSTPMLDSLGVPGPADTVRVTAAGALEVALAVPSRATLARRMCRGWRADRRRAAVRVIVLDRRSGAPLRDVSARVWWRSFTGGISTRNLTEHIRGTVARLDSLGSFTACDLPADETIHVESLPDSLPVWGDSLRVSPAEVGWRVLRVMDP